MSFIKKVSAVVMFFAAVAASLGANADPAKYLLTIDNQNKMLEIYEVKFGADPGATWISDTCYSVEEGASLDMSVSAPGGYAFISDKMQEGWTLYNDNHFAQYSGLMPAENLNVMIPMLVEEASPLSPDETKVGEGMICRIGPESADGYYYDNLAEAFAACGDSCATITLITDFNVYASIEIPVGVKAKLDLNGHTITTPMKVPVINRGDLIIDGVGGIDGDNLVNIGRLWILSGTYFTVDGETGSQTYFSGGTIVHYANSSGTGSEFVIAGGNIGLEQGCLPIQVTAGGTLKVIGGTFATDPTAYVETGCEAVADGKGLYNVSRTDGKVCVIEEGDVNVGEKYATLEQALSALNGGPGKIKLLSQYNASSTIQVDGTTSVTIDLNGFDVNYFDWDDGNPVFEVLEGGNLEITNGVAAIGAVAGVACVKCDANATLKISGGRYFADSYDELDGAVVSYGATTITGGEFSGYRPIIASTGTMDIQNCRCLTDGYSVVSDDVDVTISGGSYRGTVFVRELGTITISGGYFWMEVNYPGTDLMAPGKTAEYPPVGYVSQELWYKVVDEYVEPDPSTITIVIRTDNPSNAGRRFYWMGQVATYDRIAEVVAEADASTREEMEGYMITFGFGTLKPAAPGYGAKTWAEYYALLDSLIINDIGGEYTLDEDGNATIQFTDVSFPITSCILLATDIAPGAEFSVTYPVIPSYDSTDDVLTFDCSETGMLSIDRFCDEEEPPAGYADDAAAVLDGKVCRIGPAGDGEYFDSLSAALAFCGDSGMTITLICNCEGEVTVNPDIKARVDLNGRTLTPSGKGSTALVNFGDLVIEDSYGEGQVAGDGVVNSGTLWIRSGTVNGVSCDDGRAHISGGRITGVVESVSDCEELVISGGDILSTLSESTSGTLKVSGGIFYGNDPESYLASEYAVDYDGKFMYFVSPANDYVCEIVGGSRYTTLSAAFNAVGDSETVRLLKNITVDSAVVIGQKTSPTLDLNGFNIECVADYTYAIVVPVGAALTINNTTVAVGAVRGFGAVHCEGGSLVVNGGEFYGQRALYATTGNVAVHGGRFEGGDAFCFEDVTMTIDGGLFKGSITDQSKSANVSITGGYFSGDPGSYIPAGYLAMTPGAAYRAAGYVAKVVPVFFYYVGMQYAGWKAVLEDDEELTDTLREAQETPADELFDDLAGIDINTYAELWEYVDTRLRSKSGYNFDLEVGGDGFLRIPRDYPIDGFVLFNGDIVVESGKEVVLYDLDDEEKPSAIVGDTYPTDPKAGVLEPDHAYTGENCLKSDGTEPPEPPPPTVFSYTVRYNYEPKGNEAYEVTINTTHTIKDITELPDAEKPDYVFIGWATDSKAELPEYFAGDKVFNLAEAGGEIQLWARYRSANDVIPSQSCDVFASDEAGACAQVNIAVPDEAEFAAKGITDKVRDQYFGLFNKVATPLGKGDYRIRIELSTDGLTAVQTSVDQAAGQIVSPENQDAFKAIRANHDRKVAVAITGCVPGIYYSVQSSPSLEKPDWSDSTSDRVLCDSEGHLSIILPYKGDPGQNDQQFYKFSAHLTRDGETKVGE